MLYLLVALAIYHIAVNNGSVNGCDDVCNGVAVPYYHVRVLAHFKAAYAVANAGICGGCASCRRTNDRISADRRTGF